VLWSRALDRKHSCEPFIPSVRLTLSSDRRTILDPVSELPDLGAYEPLFRIGVGGMGEVYAARHRTSPVSAELVAVKRLFPHLVSDASFVDMLFDEARMARAVSSPHVVRVLDVGQTEDKVPYLVMELITGSDLASLIARGKLPVDAAIAWVAQAAQGLHAAHEARSERGESLGLVHRDVSPENVLIGLDGIARVGDFGIAYARERIQAPTAFGRMKGKLAYMSPEQSRGEPLDRRSDVFSLGIVAWEALVSEPLFQAKTATDVVSRIRDAVIVPPHEKRSEVSKAASDAVMKALSRERELRFETALAFAEALSAGAHEHLPASALAEVVEHATQGPLKSLREGLSRTWPQAITALDLGNTPQVVRSIEPRLVAVIAGSVLFTSVLFVYLLTR
jgi:serine/threonine protein kinase